jgi:hypothetical protein
LVLLLIDGCQIGIGSVNQFVEERSLCRSKAGIAA